ncbi:6772_t:CDS:1 [Scutellospora calospora]|uniref:6772_t:CDS:1 n=1 Tax=Scutellospora calospora TaxID=85575 RepID=A0ACA9MP28_9GLOM|nr:6772_t:CDS:1 [Scutellospora calospora]
MSNGCKHEVSLFGIIAISVFRSQMRRFTKSVLCPANISRTRSERGFEPKLARRCHIFSTHQIISVSFIQPLGFAWTYTPSGNLSQGILTNLKIMNSGSLVPSARQARVTVKQVRSWPVVRIEIVFFLDSSTVVWFGMLNAIGVSSIFPIKFKG